MNSKLKSGHSRLVLRLLLIPACSANLAISPANPDVQRKAPRASVKHIRNDVGEPARKQPLANSSHFNIPLSLQRPTNTFSTQLHVHGSFSEGSGSIASGSHEARNVGLDLLWWSDHDSYFTQYHLLSTFSFEGWTETAPTNETWIPNGPGELISTKSFALESATGVDTYSATITPEESYAESNSLKLTTSSGGPDFKQVFYEFTSSSTRLKRPLAADISLQLAVLPRDPTPDARVVIKTILSLHEPVPPAVDWEQYEVWYYFTDDSLATASRNGKIYSVPVSYVKDQWNIINLPVTQDAITGFSYLVGIDNSLFKLSLGVESRLGATAVAYFDDLHILSPISDHDSLFHLQQSLLDSLQLRIPEVMQLQGAEISDFIHLNEFGDEIVLPDYDAIAQEGGYMDANGWIEDQVGFKTYCGQYLINEAHDRGNVVSYNHMFGTSPLGSGGPDPQQTLDDLLSVGVYGADILEVGYRARGGQDLATHLWMWDQLARNQVCLVGVGVSDSHSMTPGASARMNNRMVSWIYADSPMPMDLVDGMKRGRVYFGDLIEFDGTMDLSTSTGFAMGQIIVSDKANTAVTISIDGLESGDEIRTIWAGQHVNTYFATASQFSQLEVYPIDPDSGTFLRVEVYGTGGVEKVFSNPIYFTTRLPVSGISAYKAGIDLGEFYSTSIEGITITSATHTTQSGQSVLAIQGSGNDGTIVLHCSDPTTIDSVQFTSIGGSWAMLDSLVVLTGLSGNGTIQVFQRSASGNLPPVVSNIPDQSIIVGSSFLPVVLDDYVSDPDDADSEIRWTTSSTSALAVSIDSNRVATVMPTTPLWTGSESVSFIATDPAGLSSSDTTLFTVDTPAPFSVRTNAGGNDFTDSNGNLFVADRAYAAGGFGYTGGLSKIITSGIAGTDDDLLYQTLRTAPSFYYTFDGLPTNDYTVTLCFQEPSFAGSGLRVFDVIAEGIVRLNDFDIFTAANARLAARAETFTVHISDGQLNLSFVRVSGGSALVCAIDIVSAAPPPLEPTISVSSDTVAFGDTSIGDTSSIPITISNVGSTPLTINSITTSEDEFSILGPSTPFDITPLTGNQVVTLQFHPESDSVRTESLYIRSNDPDDTLITVILTGKGLGSLPSFTVRTNAGGIDFVDSGGKLFVADRVYVAGSFGYSGGSSRITSSAISGTNDDLLYQAFRVGAPFSYSFDGLPVNDYLVTLYFQDPSSTGSGQRVFDVSAESIVRLNDFDIFASTPGRLTAHTETFTVHVADGQLSLSFVKVTGASPLVCAVEVIATVAKSGDRADEARNVPPRFELCQNYPNPFNPETAIRYTLTEESWVQLRIYNILGEEVKTLVDEVQEEGYKTVVWNGQDNSGELVSSGVYLCRIHAGTFVETRKMVHMK
jgi:hypothetical protein